MLSQDNIIQDNIAQVKTLCNVLFDAPDKSAQEKLQFNVVVRLFVQHSTGQNPMRCCPRGPRQYCIIKNQVQICLTILAQHCTDQFPKKFSIQCYWLVQMKLSGFFPVQCCLEPLGRHYIEFFSMKCCPRSIKKTLNRIFPMQCCAKSLRQH